MKKILFLVCSFYVCSMQGYFAKKIEQLRHHPQFARSWLGKYDDMDQLIHFQVNSPLRDLVFDRDLYRNPEQSAITLKKYFKESYPTVINPMHKAVSELRAYQGYIQHSIALCKQIQAELDGSTFGDLEQSEKNEFNIALHKILLSQQRREQNAINALQAIFKSDEWQEEKCV